jgi:HEAT repeat protein
MDAQDGHALQVEKWLKMAPATDAPRNPSVQVAPSWEAWASAGKGIESIEATLIQRMLHDPDAFKRAEGAMALGFVGGDAAAVALVAALKSDVPQVAMEAAGSLGRLHRAEAVEALCGALGNPDVNVRANACTALGNFKTEPARACLNRATKDSDGFVRAAAEEALRRQAS